MKKIIATSLVALTLAAGMASAASAAKLSGYPYWAQKAFDSER